MTGGILGQIQLQTLLQSPITWGVAVSALGLWVSLLGRDRRLTRLGNLLAAVGLIILAIALPKLSDLSNFDQWAAQITFWLLAAVAVGCSAAAITAHNPVYTAIWFAGSLLGVAGLFLFQHAQFLGFATVVVYAGAIVVTFLFVLMLANPEGHAKYDRISWGNVPISLMVFVGALLVIILASSYVAQPLRVSDPMPMAHSSEHVALLGGELFAKHLVAVEVAGTILLVALVGAVAIVIQGKGQTVGSAPIAAARDGGELP